MVEMTADDGKKTDMMRAWTPVVAGALHRDDGRWLMNCRPEGKHHGGLWEFPGGKVESHEIPIQSLIRELEEELGIVCHAEACRPFSFAEGGSDDGQPAIVILLYTVGAWDGEPQALEGGAVGWFTPDEALALSKPPLDVWLAEALFLNRQICA